MTNRLLFAIAFHLLITTAFGQSRREVDSMLHALDKSRPDLHRIDLLLNLAQFHIFKPGEFQVDFDSAIVYINEAKALNRTLNSSDVDGYALLSESMHVREMGQKDEAKKMTEKAIKILESGTNKFYLAVGYYELAFYYPFNRREDLAQKIQLVEKSVRLFQQTGTTKKKARAMEMLGDLYKIDGQHSKAIDILKQAVTAYDTLKYDQLQGVYVILGGAYLGLEDYGQSLFYLLKALKTAHAQNDTSIQLYNINHSIAKLYSTIGNHEMTKKYMQEALRTARKYKDDEAVFILSVNLAATYNNMSRPERGLEVLDSIPESYKLSLNAGVKVHLHEVYLRNYLSLKQYDKGQPLIEPILTAVEGNALSPHARGIAQMVVAKYYFGTNQYAKTRIYLAKSIEDNVKAKYRYGVILDSQLQYKLDSAQGDFHSAFNHLLFYKTKMDSILGENRIRQLQVLGVEYETTLKEDSIKLMDKNILLLTQQNTLQQANLQQANLIKNVTIGGTALGCVIIVLLYRLYRQKQKSNNVITQKSEQLQHFLTEKEWLLKEVHHRVKNNLQIVMSLLNSQSAFIDNGPALTAIHDSQHRVHAISLIHQKLYNAENVSSIDVSFYIRELVSYLSDSFSTGQRIRFEINGEKLDMDVGQAVPLGLILNEAITNSIKYAFPDGRDGVITISLATTISHHYELKISDNGVGLPSDFDIKRSGSLGMSLIAGLSEDLEGNFSIESNNGTTLKISFVHDLGVKRTGKIVESFSPGV